MGVPQQISPRRGHALSFPDDSFDASRADRSLMHVPDAERVLAEMKRVTKPGGRIVAFEVVSRR